MMFKSREIMNVYQLKNKELCQFLFSNNSKEFFRLSQISFQKTLTLQMNCGTGGEPPVLFLTLTHYRIRYIDFQPYV